MEARKREGLRGSERKIKEKVLLGEDQGEVLEVVSVEPRLISEAAEATPEAALRRRTEIKERKKDEVFMFPSSFLPFSV